MVRFGYRQVQHRYQIKRPRSLRSIHDKNRFALIFCGFVDRRLVVVVCVANRATCNTKGLTGSSWELDSLAVPSDYVEVDPVDTGDPGGDNSSLSVYVHEDSNWGSGYCNTVTVTNVSTENIVWEITIEVPGTIGTPWNATIVSYGTGDDITFAGVNWNAELTPGNSAEFGFCAEL